MPLTLGLSIADQSTADVMRNAAQGGLSVPGIPTTPKFDGTGVSAEDAAASVYLRMNKNNISQQMMVR